MSSSYTKIQSNQSGPYTSQLNLVDFHIPPDVYDFSKSYVEVNVYNDVVDSDVAHGEGVYNYTFGLPNAMLHNADNDESVLNVCLVKNVHIRNEAKGILENIRRVDRLRQNLHTYNRSDENLMNEGWNALSSIPRSSNILQGPFVELHGYGVKPSVYRNNVLKIPLSHLVSIGGMSAYDGNRFGMTTLHLELNKIDGPNGIVSNQRFGSTDPRWADMARSEFLDIPINTAAFNQIVTAAAYPEIKNSPWFVGMKVLISAVANPGGVAPALQNINEIRRIVGIAYDTVGLYDNDNTDRLILTLDANLVGTNGVDNYITMTAEGIDATSNSIHVSDINLVLNKPENVNPPQGPIEYTTYTLEDDHGGGRGNFKKMYEVEAEAKNVYVCFTNDIYSTPPTISSYRFMVDNVEITDRDVDFPNAANGNVAPAHKELITKTLKNGGEFVRNIQELAYTGLDVHDALAHTSQTAMIGCPLPITTDTKLLHIEINSAGLNDFGIYKEVQRSI